MNHQPRHENPNQGGSQHSNSHQSGGRGPVGPGKPLPPPDWNQLDQHVKPKGWFARNWFWVVPLVGGPLLICGGCLVVPFMVATSMVGVVSRGTEVYQGSQEAVENSTAVGETFGEPLSFEFSFDGSYSDHNGEGDASFGYSIEGPKATGRVDVVASKRRFRSWEYSKILVTIDGSGETIDVLAESELEPTIQPSSADSAND